MAEYTSTKEGFQRAMEEALNGAPQDSIKYFEATATPSFYHSMNNHRLEKDAYIKSLEEWRGKISGYKPVVKEFLRDGDQLAARMIGVIKVEGVDTEFESFMFAKVEKETGKMEYLIERSIWGEAGNAPEHGVALKE